VSRQPLLAVELLELKGLLSTTAMVRSPFQPFFLLENDGSCLAQGVLLACLKKFDGVGEWNIFTAAEPLAIQIISRDAGKPSIASTAHSLYNAHRLKARVKSSQDTSEIPEFKISSSELNSLLEGTFYKQWAWNVESTLSKFSDKLPSPDLMIIHSIDPPKSVPEPLELHGYPPWQVRLTEL
jgi:hypothetical protein